MKTLVTPQRQISWQETIDGIIYIGTLQLIRKDYSSNTNITTAVYWGILVPKK